MADKGAIGPEKFKIVFDRSLPSGDQLEDENFISHRWQQCLFPRHAELYSRVGGEGWMAVDEGRAGAASSRAPIWEVGGLGS